MSLVLSRLGAGFGAVGGKLSVIRLRPFDTSTPEGRSLERKRLIGLSALASMAAKIISVSTALISVPLTLHYLGAERYGMWMVLSTLAASLSFADMGVGNGILNLVAKHLGHDDYASIRDVVSGGYAILACIALVIPTGFLLSYNHVPWERLFNVTSDLARAESGPAVLAFVLCFALALPLGVVQKVQMGLQRGFMASLWQCAASLFGLAGVLVAIHYKASIFWLVLGYMGGPLLAGVLNSFVFFGWLSRHIRPRFRLVRREACGAVLRTGGLFFILQLVVTATFTTDSLILAQVLGASSIANYAVPEKLFSLSTMLLAMMLAPLWPAYGEAIARRDYAWAKRTLRRSREIAFVVTALSSLLLVFFGPFILSYWVGGAVNPPLLLLIGLGLWKVIEGQGVAMSMFFNGANEIRFMIFSAILTAISALCLKILFTQQLGVAGTVWGTIVAYLTFALIPFSFHCRKYFARAGHTGVTTGATLA